MTKTVNKVPAEFLELWEGATEAARLQALEILRRWSSMTTAEKRAFLDDAQEGRL